MDCRPPGSSVLGILQARILEWVAISFTRGSSRSGIKPGSPALQADSFPFKPPGKPRVRQPPLIYRLVDWGTSSNFPHNYTTSWADLHSHNSSWSLFLKGDLESEKRKSCLTLSDPMDLYSPWNSPGQNTGVGSLSLLQGIFQPRNQTQVSHIAGGFITSWSTREALSDLNIPLSTEEETEVQRLVQAHPTQKLTLRNASLFPKAPV